MSKFVKVNKITYLYAFLLSLAFCGILFIFANKLNITSSVVPFVIVSVFDIANVLLVRKASPRECFGPFMVSSITIYVLYKIVAVSSLINMRASDGFLTDGEFSHSYVLDLLMLSLVFSTFMFNVFLRFMMSKQKLKAVSKVSIKRLVICVAVFIVIAIADIASWQAVVPYKEEYLQYVSTFSSEKWAKFPQSRINMYDDFEANYNLVGMEKTDVEKLLGNSDKDDEDIAIYKLGDNTEGHNRLEIKYDNNIVVNTEVKTEVYLKQMMDKE